MEAAYFGGALGVLGALVLAVLLPFFYHWFTSTKQAGSYVGTLEPPKDESTGGQENKSKSKKKFPPDRRNRDLKAVFDHRWLLTSLKGHTGNVLDMDFSSNGKYLASCADDRSIMVWNTKDFTEKEHRSVRANVEYDHATKLRWSPDSKAFIIAQATGNTVEVFKLGKKADGSMGNIQSALTFPKKHNADIIGVGIACTGRFIMTASCDTTIVVWDLKGEVLAIIDNLQMTTHCASVSPCGRFVASSGFTPDVKVWEVCFTKAGEFKQVSRVFELKGHSAGVYSFSFNNDSTRMATISKDGTWRLWDTKIEYSEGQEPYLLLSVPCPHSSPSLIALSPDARAVAVAFGSSISVFSGITGKQEITINDVHSDRTKVLMFDNKYLLSAGDKHIRVFHNVVGYRATIQDLEEKKRKAGNQSMKDRLQQQIDEAKEALKSILHS